MEQSGAVDGAPEGEGVSVWVFRMHGDQARIHAVIPFLRNSANPGTVEPSQHADNASLRSCS